MQTAQGNCRAKKTTQSDSKITQPINHGKGSRSTQEYQEETLGDIE